MSIGEQLQPAHGPTGLTAPDGFPWARLVTGVFAVAMSLTMSWRAGRTPVEPDLTQAPQPNQEQPATAALPDPCEPDFIQATAPLETLSPAAPAQMAHTPPRRSPASSKRHELRRVTTQAKAPSDSVAHRNAGVSPRSIDSSQIARARLTRKRSDVRREYIAAREQVAALTGEDSGSAYLARLAARQSAPRKDLIGHAQNRSQGNRAVPARS